MQGGKFGPVPLACRCLRPCRGGPKEGQHEECHRDGRDGLSDEAGPGRHAVLRSRRHRASSKVPVPMWGGTPTQTRQPTGEYGNDECGCHVRRQAGGRGRGSRTAAFAARRSVENLPSHWLRGAIDQGDGRDAPVSLRWQERGGPPVSPPAQQGFGLRLIERSLALELAGEVHIAYEPSEVVCDVSAPVPVAWENGVEAA